MSRCSRFRSRRVSRRAAPGILVSYFAAVAIASCDGTPGSESSRHADWPDFLGGPDSSQFSPLDRIDRTNIGSLEQAWRYEFPGNGQSFGNPLVIGGRMYVPWSGGVIALDAASGRELWRHDAPGVYMRGLSSWLDERTEGRRLFYTLKDRLHAIDASDGSPVRGFGDAGSVDLKHGLDRDPARLHRIESQSPGRVYGNLIILGSTGGDAWNGPSGYIRAYDVRSGDLVWTFHSIPQPGEPNFGGWPEDAWKTIGGVNNWTGMTLDVDSGTLFVPFASANDNFYGVNRPGDNLYANSLVALDAQSGRYLWHFQTVHHDLWDYDLPQAPKLLTLRRDGRRIDAVAVAGKTGFVYTFDRRTGRPVFPIEERPVPQSDMAGEQTSPTQPFPVAPPPFALQRFSADDLSPYLAPDERADLLEMLSQSRNEGMFTPPSRQGTVTMPGTSGGTNWGNGVVDRRTGRLFLVAHEVPSILRLERASDRAPARFLTAASRPGATVYAEECARCHGSDRKGQPPAVPSLVDVGDRMAVDAFRDVVERGRATMPGISLSGRKLGDLLEYLGYPEATVEGNAEPSEAADSNVDLRSADSPIHYRSGFNFLFSTTGLPASAPPWSTLTALDMNTGELLWRVPYGELSGLVGSGTVFPRGAIVGTAGGLLIAANQDRKLRAWDMDTGEVILEKNLPSTPNGVPAVYQVDGRQFIAVPAASWDPQIAKMVPSGVMPEGRNSLVAFALPVDAADARPE